MPLTALARPLRLDDPQPRVILSPEQLHVLLGLAERHRDGALWVVAIATGARQSELLGLRWSTSDEPRGDVDLEARTLRITKTLQRMPPPLREEHGEWLEQSTKTRRSTRTIPLAEIACEHLRGQRAQQEDDRLRAGARWTDDYGDLVFRTAIGGPISENHLSRSLQRALSSEGLPPIRFHDLRQATATFLALQKVPVAITMALLGHSSASSTLEVYMRVAPDLAREAADAMDTVLRRDGGGCWCLTPIAVGSKPALM